MLNSFGSSFLNALAYVVEFIEMGDKEYVLFPLISKDSLEGISLTFSNRSEGPFL